MKKYLTIVAALLTLNLTSAMAQTSGQLTDLKCGETAILIATPMEGYEFVHWVDSLGNEVSPNDTLEVEISSTTQLWKYEAVFQQIAKYALTITYDPDMGTVTGGDGQYEKGTEVKLTANPNGKCYKFVGWKHNGSIVSTNPEYTVTVSDVEADNAYEAVFEYVDFTVKVSTAAGGSVKIVKKQP